jgi:hypothetical protein
VDRIIYATITMMSVLIIYDGWQTLKLIDVAGVIVGPVLAMFLSHVFSGAMAKHIEAGRILTGQEWRRVVASETPFFLLCVPPLAIVTFLFARGVSLTDSIQFVVWFGTATLGYWGYVAGRRAGFVGAPTTRSDRTALAAFSLRDRPSTPWTKRARATRWHKHTSGSAPTRWTTAARSH